jgi:tRNA threonylcarbamoyl adenosine modification protein YeaZ
MNVLAIDQSTSLNGLSILKNDGCAIMRTWQASRLRGPELFRLIPEALTEASLCLTDINVFAVGTGPGSFTGIRAAVAAVRAMALPDAVPVTGISSARIIASEIACRDNFRHVCVVGDARRQRLWIARYTLDNGQLTPMEDIHLLPIADLNAMLLPDAIVASPDWDRLQSVLTEHVPAHATLIKNTVSPSAERAARLAREAAKSGQPFAEPIPIYLHPPVSIAPRFPIPQEAST